MIIEDINRPPGQEIGSLLGDELGVIKIPPRPAVLLSIEREIRSGAPNYAILEQMISIDVSISASLIKIANSAFFGYGGHVRSVKHALHVLGLKTVASAIAALSLRKTFAHVPNLERFWDSSGRTAQLSGWMVTQISPLARQVKPEEAFTFGLFRDCGIPVILSMYADYLDVLKKANSEEVEPFTEVEENEMGIGIDHAMIGAELAKEWQLPIELRTAIEWHHDADTIRGLSSHLVPDVSRYFMAIAQLSEFLFQQLTGLDKTCEWKKLGRICLEVLHLAEDDIESLMQKARECRVHVEPAF